MWKILLLILPIIIISCKEKTIDPSNDQNQQHVGITPGCLPGRTNTADAKRVRSVACVTKNGKYAFLRNNDDWNVTLLYNMETKRLFDLHKLDTIIDGYTVIGFYNFSNCPYNDAIVAVDVMVKKDTIDQLGNAVVIGGKRVAFYDVEEKKFLYLHPESLQYTNSNIYFQWRFWNPFQWMSYSSQNNDFFYISNNEVLHLQSNTKSKIQNVKGIINAISNDGNFVISTEILNDKYAILYLNNQKINEFEFSNNYFIPESIVPTFSPDNRYFVLHDFNLLNIQDTAFSQYKNSAKTIVVDVQKSLLNKKVIPNKIFYNQINFCSAYQSFFTTFSNNYNFYVTHTQKWRFQQIKHGNLYEVSTDGKIVRSFDLENTEVE